MAVAVALWLATAASQPAPRTETSLTLEVGSVHDSLSFTADWWGEADPHYWISTAGDPHNLLRFEDLDVPRGARITEARIIVWSFNVASEDPADHVTVWMELRDDSPAVESPSQAWDRMRERGQELRWPTVAVGRDQPQPSPDLAHLVQEIVSRAGWEAGNDVLFFARSAPTPAHDGRQMHSFHTGTAGATRPVLEVAYDLPNSLVEAIAVDPRLATFHRALQESGLESAVAGAGQVTVFAPTDEAFEMLDPDTVAALFEDATALRRFVRFHLLHDDVILMPRGRRLADGALNPMDSVLSIPGGILAEDEDDVRR